MIKIYFLGTGGYAATNERDNTAFLVDNKESLILVDCPGSVIQKLKKLDCDPRKITSIIITHIHPDHIYGLPSFVHSLMLDECFIRLYGSSETINFCKKLLDLFHLRDKDIKAKIDFIPLQSGENFVLEGSIQCESIKVPHSPSSLAYYLDFEGERKKLIYSGDAPPVPLLFQKAKGIDCLIHESSAPSRFFKKYPSLLERHTHSLELGRLSQEAEVKCLVPCHFFGEIGYLLSEIEEEIRRYYKGRLIMPEDLGQITI